MKDEKDLVFFDLMKQKANIKFRNYWQPTIGEKKMSLSESISGAKYYGVPQNVKAFSFQIQLSKPLDGYLLQMKRK